MAEAKLYGECDGCGENAHRLPVEGEYLCEDCRDGDSTTDTSTWKDEYDSYEALKDHARSLREEGLIDVNLNASGDDIYAAIQDADENTDDD